MAENAVVLKITTSYLVFLLACILSVGAQHTQFVNDSISSSFENGTNNCGMWFYYNSSKNGDCQCLPHWLVTCDGKDVFVDSGRIISYKRKENLLSQYTLKSFISLKRYNMKTQGKVQLPRNISSLNDYICMPLNRKGYLCSECSDGFGPSMIVSMCTDNKCYPCSESWLGIMVYILLEFVPVTLLYLLFFFFQVQITSAPMTCFIMYSQMIVFAFNKSCDEHLLSEIVYSKNGSIRSYSKVILTLYGLFNLDMLRYTVPPFCVSSQLKPVHVALLDYCLAFYPFLLVIMTWICVELHDRNFRFVVIFWKAFHRVLVNLRRQWTAKSDNIIDVFASFFLLSYNKILYQTLLFLNNYRLLTFSLSSNHSSYDYVLSADMSVTAGSTKYISIVTVTVFIFCVFNVLPILLLSLYPSKAARALLLKKCTPWTSLAINTFVEKFNYCYRDGLDGGRDMRCFAGLYIFLRVTIVLVPLALCNAFLFETWFVRGTTFSVVAILVAICKPYKKYSSNIWDTILLFYLSAICHLLSSNVELRYFVPLMQTVILFPFVIFGFITLLKLLHKFSIAKSFSWHKSAIKTDFSITTGHKSLNQSVSSYGTIDSCKKL